MKSTKRVTMAIGVTLTAGVLLAGIAAGCRSAKNDEPAASSAGAALPDGLLLASEPAGAVSVVDAKASNDGQTVTVVGRIGGRRDPFVAGRAVMVLADLSLPACDARGDDHCPTPWDYCCEPPDAVQRHAVTVQVDGPDGTPLRAGLASGPIQAGKFVVVQGVLRKTEHTSTIHATGIHVRN